MESNNRIRPLFGLLCILVSLIVCSPVFSYDNPELLPKESTPVIDLARTLSQQQKEQLEDWDIYPTHIYIPNDYWTVSTSTDEFDKKKRKKKK